MTDKWGAKRQLAESGGISAAVHLGEIERLVADEIFQTCAPRKTTLAEHRVLLIFAVQYFPTPLVETKKAFREKVAKKQPDLVVETVFDESNRPKMVLGSVPHK